MNKLIPLVLLLIGIGGGVGAGLALRTPPDADHVEKPGHANAAEDGDHSDAQADENQASTDHGDSGHEGSVHGAPGDTTYVKMNNQFVVPIVTGDAIDALIVMSLSIEIPESLAEDVYLREPKLRDLFLQVMFDHANMGGFRGTFTDTGKLESLRRGFLDVAQSVLGEKVTAVLITDIIRQSM